MEPNKVTPIDARRRDEVLQALHDFPREPQRLLDALHVVRNACGAIDETAEKAVGEHLGLMHGRVAETVSFYSYLTLGRKLIRPCTGLSCVLKGGDKLLTALQQGCSDDWSVLRVPCLGRCEMAPIALVGSEVVPHATPETCRESVARGGEGPLLGPVGEPHTREWKSIPLGESVADIDAWRTLGGLQALEKVAEMTAEQVIDELNTAGLVGCGGAGFPTGRKWSFMLPQILEGRTVIVNADEGEPGTFKDRWIMERNPYAMLEGTMIAARAIPATEVIVYIRAEYDESIVRCRRAIDEFREAGLLEGVEARVAVGAGAYICGEETALLESLEGRRGMPRLKPPYPVEVGYLGRPTLINNVETLAHVPAILREGGAWFAGLGVRGGQGVRLFSLSGDVERPGVYELPVGTTARELIEEHGGGVIGGRSVKAWVPGGAATGFLSAAELDVPMDIVTLREAGGALGSAAVIVLDETRSVREACTELLRFFEEESCQQCTPCRLGTRALHHLLQRDDGDIPEGAPGFVERVDSALKQTSICGLGMAAGIPLLTGMRFFPDEFKGFHDD
jgi:NADH:ubiquinone oxidoreductase subunit F (NADH-binding)/NADH:ubiquinone oxidoreductase subunit E